MQYNQPFDQPTNPNAPFVDGNPGAGLAGSIPPAAALEFTQREIVAPIAESGQTPSNADPKQLLRAVRGGQLTTFTDQSSAANAIVLSPGTAHTDLHKGLPFRIFPAFTNTSATVTVQVNTLTTSLRRRDGTQPAPGDIVAGVPIDVVSDGTNFRILGFTPSDIANLVASAATAAGYVQVGDQSYGASASDRVIATSAAFTVPRSITLPSAGARLAGDTLVFMDRSGAVSAFNPLTFAATGTDTLDGAPSFTIGAPFQVVTFRSDGSGRWTYDRKASTAFRPAGDADVTVLASDGTVSTSVPLTASRTWTLPSANAVKAGTPIILTDIFGACGPGTTVTLAGKGTDTLNGQPSIALSTAFFQAMAISDGISRWAIQVVDPKQFTTVTAALADGGVLVSVLDQNHLQVLPKNGGTIYVGGALQIIPSAGLTLANVYNGVAAPVLTRFYLYLAVVAGVQTFELSTTGHVTDGAGREVKIGDAGRRLVGMAYTDASGHFVDSPAFRGVLNWFNQDERPFDSGYSNSPTIAPGASALSGNVTTVLSWGRRPTHIQGFQGTVEASGYTLQNSVDGAAVELGVSVPPANSTGAGNVSGLFAWSTIILGEGVHTLQTSITTQSNATSGQVYTPRQTGTFWG